MSLAQNPARSRPATGLGFPALPGPRDGQEAEDLRRHLDSRPSSSPRRRAPWLRTYLAGLLVIDLVAAAVGLAVAQIVRFGPLVDHTALLVSAAFPFAWLLTLHLTGGYHIGRVGSGNEEFQSLIHSSVIVVAACSFTSYAFNLDLSRVFVVIAIPTTVTLSALGRYVARRRVHTLRRNGRCMRRVVAVGRAQAVADLVDQLRRESYCGMLVVGACVPDQTRTEVLTAAGVPVLGDLTEVTSAVDALEADTIAVTSPSEAAARYLRELSWKLEGTNVDLLVAPGLMEVAGPRLHVRPFVGLPLLAVESPAFSGSRRILKGLLDRAVAALVLLLIAPVMLAVAAAIEMDSRGPVFYRQQRIGRHGKPFTMYKFRSMVDGAHALKEELREHNVHGDGPLFKVRNDSRVTRVGRYLRRYSLDELPQLVNVLQGRMSLVGPRPPLPEEVVRYADPAHRRFLVTPGLTGLWQVSGRSDLNWDDAVRLDLRYVENWSLSLDLLILWKTAGAVFRGRGAY